MLTLDHIAIVTSSLDEGSRLIEDALGMPLEGGGQHLAMGTHNRLLSLGPDYLEVIAIDPRAIAPAQPRWFDLDNVAGPGRPGTWVCRCEDLAGALLVAPPGTGEPLALARGDLRWQMAVPGDGKQPFQGLFPALMQWEGSAHPSARLTDRGARLMALELHSPQAEALGAVLAPLIKDPRIVILQAPEARLRVRIATAAGTVLL